MVFILNHMENNKEVAKKNRKIYKLYLFNNKNFKTVTGFNLLAKFIKKLK
jgi:hypothetical protein